MKKIIAVVLVLSLSSLFAADAVSKTSEKPVVKTEKKASTEKAKKVTKAKKVAKKKKAKKMKKTAVNATATATK